MVMSQMAFCRSPAGVESQPGQWGHLTPDLLLEAAWLLADADVQARCLCSPKLQPSRRSLSQFVCCRTTDVVLHRRVRLCCKAGHASGAASCRSCKHPVLRAESLKQCSC